MSDKQKKYKMMKVFNCQDMPSDVKNAFFKCTEARNDCYVDWYYRDSDPEDEDSNSFKVDSWLHDNGLGEKSETVLIKHWW